MRHNTWLRRGSARAGGQVTGLESRGLAKEGERAVSVSCWLVLGGGGAATGPNWWISLRFISNLTGETTTKGYKMPAADPKTRKHFTFKEEAVNNASAKSKVRTRVDCNHCNALRVLDGSWAVFSNLDRLRCHLTGDQDICRMGIKGKGNGGIGPCPNVPEEVAEEFVVQVRTRQQQIQQKNDGNVGICHPRRG